MILNIKNNVLMNCIIEDSDKYTVVIPEGVTAIAEEVFKNNKDLLNITLPSTLVLIGREAFAECIHLKSIVIPDSVKDIGKSAFYGCCSLKSVTLPDGLIEIMPFTFGNTALKEIILPDSLEYIANAAFTNSCLTEIIIPASVKEIGKSAFLRCLDLETVEFAGSPQIIGPGAFYDCISLKSIDIPEGTAELAPSAFYSCSSLKNVTLPGTLRKIGEFCFGIDPVTEIEIPDGVEEIDYLAFYQTRLRKIVLPDSVKKIEGHFVDSKVEVLPGENNPNFIRNGSFILSRDGKTLYHSIHCKEAIIPDGVETIESYSFDCCKSLERVVMPPSVTAIGKAAFSSCERLREVVFSPNLRSIDAHAFLYCKKLGKITLPDSLEELSDCFTDCPIENLVIPPKAVINDNFFYWHGINAVKNLTINVAACDLPPDDLFSDHKRKAVKKILKGFVQGMNMGYPFSAEVIEKNHQWINGMGAASLIDFSEEFIFYTLKTGIISPENAEKLLDIYPDISLSLRSAIADYTSTGSDPLDKFKL